MPLPTFNARGDLPEGVHQATLAEVVARLGQGAPSRQRATAALLLIHQLVSATGLLDRFVIYGSYVTDKPAPNDVDIFLVLAAEFDIEQLTGETRILFSHSLAQQHFGTSVFWVNRSTSFANVEDLIEGWQTKRDLTRRGIVEVIQ